MVNFILCAQIKKINNQNYKTFIIKKISACASPLPLPKHMLCGSAFFFRKDERLCMDL